MANGNGITFKALKFWGSVVGVAAAAAMAWGMNSARLTAMETAQTKQSTKVEEMGKSLHSIDKAQAVIVTEQKAITKTIEEIKQILAKPK